MVDASEPKGLSQSYQFAQSLIRKDETPGRGSAGEASTDESRVKLTSDSMSRESTKDLGEKYQLAHPGYFFYMRRSRPLTSTVLVLAWPFQSSSVGRADGC